MAWDNDAGNQWPRWKPWDYFGYYYLGPVQVPPPLPVVGMTDRTTGTVWYLCFDPSNGDRLSLTDTLPTSSLLTVRVYGAWDGPFIGSYGLRMGVDQVNGSTHLIFDAIVGLDAGNSPVAFELNTGSDEYAVVLALALSNPNFWDHLAYQVLSRQPANPTGPNEALPGETL